MLGWFFGGDEAADDSLEAKSSGVESAVQAITKRVRSANATRSEDFTVGEVKKNPSSYRSTQEAHAASAMSKREPALSNKNCLTETMECVCMSDSLDMFGPELVSMWYENAVSFECQCKGQEEDYDTVTAEGNDDRDLPPPLVSATLALNSDVEMLVAKDQVVRAASVGGDIMLLTPTGGLVVRATVRKVELDFWLEVTFLASGGQTAAIARLTNKGMVARATAAPGPEIFDPEGTSYGWVDMRCPGIAQLFSSASGQVLLTVNYCVDGSNIMVLNARTPRGVNLANVTCSGGSYVGDVKICVRSGADLVLMVSLILAVILAAQA